MPSAAAIISRLDKALNKTNATSRVVYKRIVTRSGGDDLIGRPATITNTDTILLPQPMCQRLGRNLVGGSAPEQTSLSSGGGAIQIANDYAVIFSPSAMTRTALSDPNLLILLVDTVTSETEVFRITDMEPTPYLGQDVMITAYMRSTKRAAVA